MCHFCNLFEGKFFVEAEDKNLAIERLDAHEGCGQAGSVFEAGVLLEGSGGVGGDLKLGGVVVLMGGFDDLVEAGHGAFAAEVDDQIAGNGEEPGVEACLGIELSTADENAHPDLLKEVFGLFSAASEVKQVTHEAVLELNDELVEQAGILTLESLGDGQALLVGEFTRLSLNGGGPLADAGAEHTHTTYRRRKRFPGRSFFVYFVECVGFWEPEAGFERELPEC